MKILPINSANNEKRNTNFQGLWGPTENNSQCITKTVYKYYPFKDETREQIKKIVDTHSEYKKEEVTNALSKVVSSAVKVMEALPFTSKEFMNYTLNKLPITKQRLIEKHFMHKNLSVLKK